MFSKLEFQAQWTEWAAALLALFLVWLAAYFLLRLVFYSFERWSKKTSTYLDDIIISSSKYHLVLWAFLPGAFAAGKIAPLDAQAAQILARSLLSILLLSLTFLIASIASLLVTNYGRRAKLSLPLTSLTNTLVRVIIIIIGVLILLANLGISITPLLTALGVGSLAVALALQDTLSNLFAGFNILAGRQILPGNYIRLEGGQEGYVADIGWRVTRIKELSNNVIIIPNNKLASSIVTNYYSPTKDVTVSVQLGVAYSSDLEKVERITIETARETLKTVAGGVPDFEPAVRYNSFGDSAINFSVILKGKEFADKFLLTHEFIKLLHKRYKEHGIEIPFPQRVLHTIK